MEETTEGEGRLLKARRVYATGLLAIALTKTEVCVEAVRSGFAVHMAQVRRATAPCCTASQPPFHPVMSPAVTNRAALSRLLNHVGSACRTLHTLQLTSRPECSPHTQTSPGTW
jgi:hypothetical protein